MFLIVYNGRLLRSATCMHWITLAHGRFLKASFQAYNSPRLCHPRKQRWTFQLPSLCGIYGRPLRPFTHLAIHWVTRPGSLEAKAQLQPFSAESRQSCFTLCEATFYCNELCLKKSRPHFARVRLMDHSLRTKTGLPNNVSWYANHSGHPGSSRSNMPRSPRLSSMHSKPVHQ